jgi:hypothetical protein
MKGAGAKIDAETDLEEIDVLQLDGGALEPDTAYWHQVLQEQDASLTVLDAELAINGVNTGQ